MGWASMGWYVSLRTKLPIGHCQPQSGSGGKRSRKKDEANYRQVTGMHTQGQVPSETAAEEKQTLKPYVNCPPSKGGPPWRATAARKRKGHKWQRAKCEEQMAKAKCRRTKHKAKCGETGAERSTPRPRAMARLLPREQNEARHGTTRQDRGRRRTPQPGEPTTEPRPRTNPARRGPEGPRQRKERRWAKCSTSQGTRKCRQVATDPGP